MDNGVRISNGFLLDGVHEVIELCAREAHESAIWLHHSSAVF